MLFAWSIADNPRALHVVPSSCDTVSDTIAKIYGLYVAEEIKSVFKASSTLLGTDGVHATTREWPPEVDDGLHLFATQCIKDSATLFK